MGDREAILQAASDYIEGWYQGDAKRMDRALSDKLVKRRVTPTGEVWEVNKDWMVEATGSGKGRIDAPDKGRKEITILDMTERISSVMIISNKFIDYLHFAKVDAKWEIVNVIWDYENNEKR